MKPMLSTQCELSELKYPLYASAKLDGVRGIIIDGVLHSRSLKKFPNAHVMSLFSKPEYSGLDGELILGSPTAKDVFRVTSGACQRHDGTPDVKFYVFDKYDVPSSFIDRWVMPYEDDDFAPPVVRLEQKHIESEKDLLEYETACLEKGYEGLILRDPNGLYKFGRSTLKEGAMLKLKRMATDECEILGFIEANENTNEKKTNELGRGKRSSHQAGMVPKGTLGALEVRDLKTKIEFNIGTGFSDAERDEIWKHRKKYKGAIGSYAHFEVGVKTAPRFPSWRGFRPEFDFPALS